MSLFKLKPFTVSSALVRFDLNRSRLFGDFAERSPWQIGLGVELLSFWALFWIIRWYSLANAATLAR